jgi:hypothetical protein
MSSYPYWSLNFDLRRDLPEQVMNVLRDVARDRPPEPTDLESLHPVCRFYLSDWRRMLVGELEPQLGSPLRLFRYWNSDVGEVDGLSIEFAQHDDVYADGGWVFWMWVLNLAHRPEPHHLSRRMIGFGVANRGEGLPPEIYFLDHEGIDVGSRRLSFQLIDETWANAQDDDFGYE